MSCDPSISRTIFLILVLEGGSLSLGVLIKRVRAQVLAEAALFKTSERRRHVSLVVHVDEAGACVQPL